MKINKNDRIQEIELQLNKLNSERSLLLKELTDLKNNSNSEEVALIGRKRVDPLSNSRIQDANIRYDYKKPFEMFGNVTDLRKWREQMDEFRTVCRELFL